MSPRGKSSRIAHLPNLADQDDPTKAGSGAGGRVALAATQSQATGGDPPTTLNSRAAERGLASGWHHVHIAFRGQHDERS